MACSKVLGGRCLGLFRNISVFSRNSCAAFSISSARLEEKSYKLVIVGGGTGGAATANKFSRKLGKDAVAVLEPHDVGLNIFDLLKALYLINSCLD